MTRERGWYLVRVGEGGEEFFRLNDVLKTLKGESVLSPREDVPPPAPQPEPTEPPRPPVPLPPTGQSVERPPVKCVRRGVCDGPVSIVNPTKPDVLVCHACGFNIVWVSSIQKWQPVRL